jgi:CheY-like chemotaxis protein
MDHAMDRPRGRRRILIADDDPAILRVLSDRCAKMGFLVDTAINGVQLLVKTRQNHPDILIVDVNMPALDGLSVCSRLLEPGQKPVDVIVVTGIDDPETPERCESLGAFFGRKGPELWKIIEAALYEICPEVTERAPELPAPRASETAARPPRVLVVDDDPDINGFLASRLAKFGVETLYAPNATEGYRIAGKEKPTVIVADHYMPDGDANFLLYRLRSTAGTADIPVFVISGRRFSEFDEQTLKRDICGHPGALQVFRKSYDPHELFSALAKFCTFNKPLKLKDGMSEQEWRETAVGKPPH